MKSDEHHYNKKEIVAYFGSPGSFSHMAAAAYFKNKTFSLKSKPTLASTFQTVQEGKAAYAVVPWENSTTGSIIETYDLLLDSKLTIVGEVLLHIHHHLLAIKGGVKMENLAHCYSHPQALSQCDRLLKQYPRMQPIFTADTATAAKEVAQKNKKENVALASRLAATLYNLSILRESVEDNQNNFTRFAVISKKGNKKGDKMSIAFSLAHIPGSLSVALHPFAQKGLNLTKIESRPVFGKMWEYIFFLDFEVGGKEEYIQGVLRELKEVTQFVTLLGFYRKGNRYET